MVSHAVYVAARHVHRPVDRPLRVARPSLGVDRLALEGELHNVIGRDDRWAPGARQKVTVGILGMTNADVTKIVDHPFAGQNAVGQDKVAHRVTDGRAAHILLLTA
jgi:hypothetical protein